MRFVAYMLGELEKAPAPIRHAIKSNPWASDVYRQAAALREEGILACTDPRPLTAHPDWCALCDAVHRPVSEPESTGERRGR